LRPTKYIVGCYMQMRRPFTSLSKRTMREALKSFAARFIERGFDEKDILKLRLFDNHKNGYNQNVLTQPFMRMALIDDGMVLDDPRDPAQYEYLSVRKTEHTASLLRDGWILVGPDATWPNLYDRYSREKKT
jgi:hypothetical protein